MNNAVRPLPRRFAAAWKRANRSACLGGQARTGSPDQRCQTCSGVRLEPGLKAYRPREPGNVRNRTPLVHSSTTRVCAGCPELAGVLLDFVKALSNGPTRPSKDRSDAQLVPS